MQTLQKQFPFLLQSPESISSHAQYVPRKTISHIQAYFFFLNPTHTTKIGIAIRWETTR
jgi:hypothetical protein